MHAHRGLGREFGLIPLGFTYLSLTLPHIGSECSKSYSPPRDGFLTRTAFVYYATWTVPTHRATHVKNRAEVTQMHGSRSSSGPLPRSSSALHQSQAAGDHCSIVCPHMQDLSSFSTRYGHHVTLPGSWVHRQHCTCEAVSSILATMAVENLTVMRHVLCSTYQPYAGKPVLSRPPSILK